MAIEGALLGARVVVVEMRDYITRNNVLKLWPFVIDDLKALGAKVFYPQFCTGSLDHISKFHYEIMHPSLFMLTALHIPYSISHKNVRYSYVRKYRHVMNTVPLCLIDFFLNRSGNGIEGVQYCKIPGKDYWFQTNMATKKNVNISEEMIMNARLWYLHLYPHCVGCVDTTVIIISCWR